MPASDIPADRVAPVLGTPRSGLSWLTKIVDTRTDVLYRHEPAMVLRDNDLRRMHPREQAPACRDAAREDRRRWSDTVTLPSPAKRARSRRGGAKGQGNRVGSVS